MGCLMAARAMWKAAIEFQKLQVPIKMYAALHEPRIQFHLLHDKDKVRLQQQLVCELDGKPVEKQEVIKGAQVTDDKYVVVEPEELEKLVPEASRSIEVMGFVKSDEVDGRYCNHPYLLGPDTEAEAFASLVLALEDSGRIGICRWVVRKRQYNGILRAANGLLELVTLRPWQEVRQTKELDVPAAKVSPRELKTAEYLVNELLGGFQARAVSR